METREQIKQEIDKELFDFYHNSFKSDKRRP